MQRASVEGRLFHRGSVAALHGERAPPGLGAILLALARKEFVRPDRSAIAGDDGFRFHHVLIRDVAYASLTKELRADLHARLADWLERQRESVSGLDEILGYHLERAYRYRVSSPASTTRHAHSASGPATSSPRPARARSIAAKRRRRRPSSTARAACSRSIRSLAELLPHLARALRENGALERGETVVAEAIDAARRAGDALTEQRAEIERARTAFMRTRLEPGPLRATARGAIAVFEAEEHTRTLLMPGS